MKIERVRNKPVADELLVVATPTNRRTGEPCPGDAIPAGKPEVPDPEPVAVSADAGPDLWSPFPGLNVRATELGDGRFMVEAWQGRPACDGPWAYGVIRPGLSRPVLDPCPVCGFADWPEGGMHAARSIHMRAHERAGEAPTCQTQRLLFASPPPWADVHASRQP